MNQEKIGKFIAENRKKQNFTQEQLAEKLGVSVNAVSKWERGLNLPAVSLMLGLCSLLKISLNELFTGEKIKEENYRDVADKNLITALENSSFTLKERVEYYKKKWIKKHVFTIILEVIIWFGTILGLKLTNSADIEVISFIAGFILVAMYVITRNRMMIYVENHAYRKIKK